MTVAIILYIVYICSMNKHTQHIKNNLMNNSTLHISNTQSLINKGFKRFFRGRDSRLIANRGKK